MRYENRKYSLWSFLIEYLGNIPLHEIDGVYYIGYQLNAADRNIIATVRKRQPLIWNFRQTNGDITHKILTIAEMWEEYIGNDVVITWPPLPLEKKTENEQEQEIK